MNGKLRIALRLAVIGAVAASSGSQLANDAHAADIEFTLDSTQSYLTLAIPNLILPGFGPSEPFFARGQNPANGAALTTLLSSSASSMAFIGGTFATSIGGAGLSAHDVAEGAIPSIQFLAGTSTMAAIASGNYRPNPFAYHDGAYQDSTTISGNYGFAISGPLGNMDLVSLAELGFDVSNPSALAVTSGTFAANDGTFDFVGSRGLFAMQGLALFLVGKIQPDVLAEASPGGPWQVGGIDSNPAAGSVLLSPLGNGLSNLQVTVPLTLPFSFDVNFPTDLNGDYVVKQVSGSLTGQVVANAIVPEPSSAVLAGIAFVGLMLGFRLRGNRSCGLCSAKSLANQALAAIAPGPSFSSSTAGTDTNFCKG